MKLYEILNVDSKATTAEIKKAYKKAAIANHPDRGGDAELMAQINGAWDVLQDPVKRERYDLTGETTNQPTMIDKVITHLTQRLCALMDQNDYAPKDYFKIMLDELESNVQQCDRLKITLANQIEKFEYLIEKLAVKNEALSDGLNMKLDTMKAQVDQLIQQDEAFDLTRQVLEECEYTGEIPDQFARVEYGNIFEDMHR